MNMNKLYEILNSCTSLIRVGEVVTQEQAGPMNVTTIDAMPSEAEISNKDDLAIIDCVLVKVGVNKALATTKRADFIEAIEPLRSGLEPGPSYIAIGASIGDQGAAFQFMALGEVLGLWKVITPRTLGITDAHQLRDYAGKGYVMISGYRRIGEDEMSQTEREAG
jgi:hypothetical protein